MDPVAYALAMIEIAAADCAHSTIMSVNNSLYCNGILKYGTEEQKQKYVRAIATGEAIGAYRADRAAIGLRCVRDAHARGEATPTADWVINGKKSWITSGPVAKYIVLFAMTDAGQRRERHLRIPDRHRARRLPCAARPSPSSASAPRRPARSNSATTSARADDMLGEEGKGFEIAMGVLDAGRIGIASQAVGLVARRVRGERSRACASARRSASRSARSR